MLFDALGRNVSVQQLLQHAVPKTLDHRREILVLEDLVPQLVDILALVVRDVVVLEQLLADIEVMRFNLALRALDRARHQRVLDRLTLGHLQPFHDALDALAGKNSQQRIVERQVKAR